MKIGITSILLIITMLCSLPAISQPNTYMMTATFDAANGPFFETYMSTIGNSVRFVRYNDAYRADIEVTMLCRSVDSVIVLADKYILHSPQIADTAAAKPNFVDVQRYKLPNGRYFCEVGIRDVNDSTAPPLTLHTEILVDYFADDLYFSDIELVEAVHVTKSVSLLSKNGYDMIPYIADFFPQNIDTLSFYVELYNTDKFIGDDFLLRYYIEQYETQRELPTFSKFKKLSSQWIVPFIGRLNISQLPTGNYFLVTEVVDRENRSLKKNKFFFQRSKSSVAADPVLNDQLFMFDISTEFDGSMTNIDSLRQYVSCLHPIANDNEKAFINSNVKKADLQRLQTFFMEFWLRRNNVTPGLLWKQYKEQVDFVDANYRTPINRGYATDRGRVYLQYGAPNDIYVSMHEPSAYPYEIWHYYRVNNENNRKFVFYNPNIAGKEYVLLHSNLTGEVKTPNWDRVLSKRNNTLYDHDVLTADPVYGSRALEEFNKN